MNRCHEAFRCGHQPDRSVPRPRCGGDSTFSCRCHHLLGPLPPVRRTGAAQCASASCCTCSTYVARSGNCEFPVAAVSNTGRCGLKCRPPWSEGFGPSGLDSQSRDRATRRPAGSGRSTGEIATSSFTRRNSSGRRPTSKPCLPQSTPTRPASSGAEANCQHLPRTALALAMVSASLRCSAGNVPDN